MAKKRMFTLSVVDSDAFLDMPLSTQALYFHLNMRADDDGFIGNPKRIMRLVGSSEDDLKLLIAKRFLLTFEDGVIVIKHWRMHNTIQKDRYTPTAYQDEMKMLSVKDNKSYSLNDTETKCFQNVSTDIDIGIDIDKGIGIDKDIDKEREKEQSRTHSVDMDVVWKHTFNSYPNNNSPMMAKQKWLDKLVPALDVEETAKLIYFAIKLWLQDYDKRHPDDAETHTYVKSLDKWFDEDCDYWIGVYEESLKEV